LVGNDHLGHGPDSFVVDKAEEGLSLIEKEGETDDLGQEPDSFVVEVVKEGVILIENEGGLRGENDDLGQGPDPFVIGKIEVGVVEEGLSLIGKEGVECDDLGQGPESFVVQVGVVEEEDVSLIENESGSRVENNDLGQGAESFVVEVGIAEDRMGGSQLGDVVDPVDAVAVGSGVDDWRRVDGWRGLDDWMMQKKVSEFACVVLELELEPNPGEARSDVLNFGTAAAAAVGGKDSVHTQDQEARPVQVACQFYSLKVSPRGRVVVRLQAESWGCAARCCSRQSSTNALDHLLQLSFANTILTVCNEKERSTVNECPVMDRHEHQCIDEQQETRMN
jgi:hypothetical protein